MSRSLRFLVLFAYSIAAAQTGATFPQRVEEIVNRPLFKHARFGIEFYSLDTNEVAYQLNAQQLFVPGSTTKLLSTGAALAVLGPDYRFHTRVYRAGAISAEGTLDGDIVLVGSGDPNLSGRIQPDGSMSFENVDHSYDSGPATKAVPGDPLAVLNELALKVAKAGVKRITGRVLVDINLFPEGDRDLGTRVVLSPVSVNDNLVDVRVVPGVESSECSLRVSPKTAYVRFVNETRTIAADAKGSFEWTKDVTNPDGTHTVTVTARVPAGSEPLLHIYRVPEPSRFAAVTFAEALRNEKIVVDLPGKADIKAARTLYNADQQLAEHVSPPLIEAVKVVLKVSQNLHASMLPFIIGAVAGQGDAKPDHAGFDLERKWLEKARLDVDGAAQSDGAGGAAFFSPDFMARYLAYMSRQPYAAGFRKALPILGKDGTLWDIQVNSPAAGQVTAKTGTYASYDALHHRLILHGKGLAGYLKTKDGRNYAFAIFANLVAGDPDTIAHTVGDILGEIAAAAFDAPI